VSPHPAARRSGSSLLADIDADDAKNCGSIAGHGVPPSPWRPILLGSGARPDHAISRPKDLRGA
jgi:hypothetical protein